MLADETIEAQILALSHSASDLSVGLQCMDINEVLLQSLKLQKLADEFGADLLSQTAQAMTQAAETGNLEAARLLEPQLRTSLNQAAQLLLQPFSESL
jgi:hypothetical protein